VEGGLMEYTVYKINVVLDGLTTTPVTTVDKRSVFKTAKLLKLTSPMSNVTVEWEYNNKVFTALINSLGEWEMIDAGKRKRIQ